MSSQAQSSGKQNEPQSYPTWAGRGWGSYLFKYGGMAAELILTYLTLLLIYPAAPVPCGSLSHPIPWWIVPHHVLFRHPVFPALSLYKSEGSNLSMFSFAFLSVEPDVVAACIPPTCLSPAKASSTAVCLKGFLLSASHRAGHIRSSKWKVGRNWWMIPGPFGSLGWMAPIHLYSFLEDRLELLTATGIHWRILSCQPSWSWTTSCLTSPLH